MLLKVPFQFPVSSFPPLTRKVQGRGERRDCLQEVSEAIWISFLLSCKNLPDKNLNVLGMFSTTELYSGLRFRQGKLTFHCQSYPVQENPHPWVDSWFLWTCTANTPAGNTIKNKWSVFLPANQGATRTTLGTKTQRDLAVLIWPLHCCSREESCQRSDLPKKKSLCKNRAHSCWQLNPRSGTKTNLTSCLLVWNEDWAQAENQRALVNHILWYASFISPP